MMWMFFHTQLSDTVLFKWWTVKTVGDQVTDLSASSSDAVMIMEAMLLTCVVLFLGALCFEALKWFRLVLEQRSRPMISVNASSSNVSSRDNKMPVTVNRRYSDSLLSRAHLLQTVLFTVQILVSYLLMLAFMTFSIWIGIAICAGAATGFWLFGKRMPVLAMTSVDGAGNGANRSELH